MSAISIPFGSRRIGTNFPVVIIAEIGINHEGSVSRCRKMVEAVAESGADAVKLQTVDPDENYVPGTASHDVFSRAKLSQEETAEIFHLAKSLHLEVFTTTGDMATLEWIDRLCPAAHKISSGLLTHLPLIGCVARTKRPLLMSTGMAGPEMVTEAVREARKHGAEHIGLFQCTSQYPAPPETLNIRAIGALAQQFRLPVGFSDHSVGIEAAVLAVAAGACMIEKHVSFDPEREGFDHGISLGPTEFAELVQKIRQAEIMLGNPRMKRDKAAVDMAQKSFRSLVARRSLKKGDIITKDHIGFMRTLPECRGAEPKNFEKIVGGKARQDIDQYTAITLSDVDAAEQ